MKIWRHEIPVDDKAHAIFAGRILHIATRSADVVEIWAENQDETRRTFRVVGTGWELADGWTYLGTAVVPGGVAGIGLVWHLVEEA